MYSHSESQTDYRPHERRDEHGTDYHGRGIGVEAKGGDEDGEDENDDVDASESHVVANGLFSVGLGDELGRKREVTYGEGLESFEKIVHLRVFVLAVRKIWVAVSYLFRENLPSGMSSEIVTPSIFIAATT